MAEYDRRAAGVSLDLALDVVPASNGASPGARVDRGGAEWGGDLPKARSAVRWGRMSTAGWELTHDPVYEH